MYWSNADTGSILSCPTPGCGAAPPRVHASGRQGLPVMSRRRFACAAASAAASSNSADHATSACTTAKVALGDSTSQARQ